MKVMQLLCMVMANGSSLLNHVFS